MKETREEIDCYCAMIIKRVEDDRLFRLLLNLVIKLEDTQLADVVNYASGFETQNYRKPDILSAVTIQSREIKKFRRINLVVSIVAIMVAAATMIHTVMLAR
jgi:hypothetical protein